MKNYKTIQGCVTLVFTLLFSQTTVSAAEDFPLRASYSAVETIETEALYQQRQNYTIVDVRSGYEYDTLHIKGATNVTLNDPKFYARVWEIMATSGKDVVFYCNGRTCRKSYNAAVAMLKSDVKNIKVYDAGVLEWARAHPELTVLLGKSPIKPTMLIDESLFKARLLTSAAFVKKVKKGAIILDVRDRVQRDNPLFPLKEERAPLDDKATIDQVIAKAKKAKKPLLIYDAVGKQVRWFQYYLESKGVKDYFFLKGGAEAYFKATLGKR